MEAPGERAEAATGRARLVERLREALVGPLSDGSWEQIERDHKKAGLLWRADLEPGWGKPKYVTQVLADLPDDDVIALARRVVERFEDRDLMAVENALWWIDADGVSRVSEVTRLALARMLDGRDLHPTVTSAEVLARFGRFHHQFGYASHAAGTGDGVSALFGESNEAATAGKASCQGLLEAAGFRGWPDRRLFLFVEYLVHPAVREGDEQADLVRDLNYVFGPDQFELFATEQVSGRPLYMVRPVRPGVEGRPKNLIFASTGPKPELGFRDAVNNDIVLLRHADRCLLYDEPIGAAGLRWVDLVSWWATQEGLDPAEPETRRKLGARLRESLASPPEHRLFALYFKALHARMGEALPALVPQVYLHYDPVVLQVLRERGESRRFEVQRMDFLLLLPRGVRVVVEVDGQQHYSTGMGPDAKPSPVEYARMARGDRELRLLGYEVYRFGGHELRDEQTCARVVGEFFTRLFRRHQLIS